MKVKEESEKVGLKLNIQKMKIMATGPITSWQTDGERVRDFILGSKITASAPVNDFISTCQPLDFTSTCKPLDRHLLSCAISA